MIIWVRVVLRRTVWERQEMVYMSLVVNLIGQRSRDLIGRLSVSRDVIGCEDCKK